MAKLKNKDLKAHRRAGIDPLRELLAAAVRGSRGFLGKRRARKLEKMVDPACFVIEMGVLAYETLGRREFREGIKEKWSLLKTRRSPASV